MNKNVYEHHLAIEKNDLCPFIFQTKINSFDTPINWHENIEVLVMLEGKASLKYEAVEYSLEPGDIVVINSGDMHHLYSHTGISYHYLIIDRMFCVDNGIPIENYRFREKINDPKTAQIFDHIIQAYADVAKNRVPLSAANMRRWVLSLLIDLCVNHTQTSTTIGTEKKASRENVKKMLTYINDHYSEPLTLDDIAQHVGFNKFYLIREFKKYTGQTPFAYMNILRCKKARQCLLNGMTVTEAAHESGFETLSYFSRTFCKLIGYPPSQLKVKDKA